MHHLKSTQVASSQTVTAGNDSPFTITTLSINTITLQVGTPVYQ